jgi:acyl transferase domain-containing protein
MGCRLAGADGLNEFWRNLSTGRDCITRDPSLTGEGDSYPVGAWGLMSDRKAFDSAMAGYPAKPDGHDPQHGVLLETLWSTVEDASVRLSDIGARTAVYLGCTPGEMISEGKFAEVAAADTRFLANRFSYFHGLQGESIMVDASCATGLTAVHLACQSLLARNCDYAFVGAVSIMETEGWYHYEPGGIYSSDGVCRPFDQASTGTIPGDGAAAVLLCRLTDALRAKVPIHAVIRSSAVGNDGHDKAGFIVPSVDGKIRTVRQALSGAGLTGAELGYVEAHGVGIPLNDEIEATALTEAMGRDGVPLAIGSAKASVGHINNAAGLVGLIKTALILEHGRLAATPNTRDPIRALSGGRFSIIPESRAWRTAGEPRIAGVMSAGIGGTNAFAVLQEPPLQASESSAW